MTSVDSQQSSDVFRLMLYQDLTMNSYAEFGVLYPGERDYSVLYLG